MTTTLQEPEWLKTFGWALLGYVVPFLSFYFGIYTRYVLRTLPVFKNDILTLKQLFIVGVLFSITTVAPLLPTFGQASSPQTMNTYLLTVAVVIQAGILMPEALGKLFQHQGAPA